MQLVYEQAAIVLDSDLAATFSLSSGRLLYLFKKLQAAGLGKLEENEFNISCVRDDVVTWELLKSLYT